MTVFATTPSNTGNNGGPQAPGIGPNSRASPVNNRSANSSISSGNGKVKAINSSYTPQPDLPPQKIDAPPGMVLAEKPAKAATWNAGNKTKQFQQQQLRGPAKSSASAASNNNKAGSSSKANIRSYDDGLESSIPSSSSKQSKVSLNHLLNFHLPPRQHVAGGGYSSSSKRSGGGYGYGYEKMTRERYLNAKWVWAASIREKKRYSKSTA